VSLFPNPIYSHPSFTPLCVPSPLYNSLPFFSCDSSSSPSFSSHTHQNNHIFSNFFSPKFQPNQSPMMPPQRENAVTPDIPAITNRPENSSVHAEPSSAAANHIHNNNNSQQHPQPNISPPRFSVLRQSLLPITLKVLINSFFNGQTSSFSFYFFSFSLYLSFSSNI